MDYSVLFYSLLHGNFDMVVALAEAGADLHAVCEKVRLSAVPVFCSIIFSSSAHRNPILRLIFVSNDREASQR